MRNKHSISSIVLIIAAVTLLTAFTALLSACQMATPNAASPEEAVQEAAQPRQPTVTRTLSTRTVPPSPNSAVPPAISTPAEPSSTSVSWHAMSIAIPVDIQDFVDRTDAIVIGTVASVEGPVDDLPYNVDSEFVKMRLEDPYPLPSITVTYYAIELEEIVLDDGNISGNAFIRVPGTPDSFKL